MSTDPGAIPATINLTGAKECGCAGAGGYVGDWRDCACPTGGSANANGVCACASGSVVRGEACIPEEGDFGEALSDKLLCGAFGGTVQVATGGEMVCSGMDANDTFCVMDAEEVDSVRAFPCRGLFKRLRSYNLTRNRPALNPFFCGAKCGGQKAVGPSVVNLNLSCHCSRACVKILRNADGKANPPCGGDSGHFHSAGTG